MAARSEVREPDARYLRGDVGAGQSTGGRSLLDVNVWVALFDDAHVASIRANEFIDTPGVRVATCPLVENGVIRVLNLPSYGRRGALGLQAVRNNGVLVTFDQNIPLDAVRGATAAHLRIL